jgi:glucosamine--fructose-6-phosphate aminotransferase (isomerizing)
MHHESANFLYSRGQFDIPPPRTVPSKSGISSSRHAGNHLIAEMKHVPIALVDDTAPSVFMISSGTVDDKAKAVTKGVKAQG